jgi:hypothetical protein
MTASTTITCTKSEFRANLRNHYATGVVIDKTQADELDEVIDGLVLQANEHRGTFEGHSAYLDCDFTVTPDEADEIQSAKYEVGDRLHFTPSAIRAPHGTAIDEGDVIVTGVVDHGSPTPHSPRFTYVVRALNGSGTQGTDDRELTEITIPAVTDAQRAQSADAAQSTVLRACQALATITSTLFDHDTDAEMVEALAADLHALADQLRAAAGHLHVERPRLTEGNPTMYVVISQSWRQRTSSSPWHILREGVTTPGPTIEGICGTETAGSAHWQVVRAGSAPGRLCDRCRREIERTRLTAYEAQGPRR